MLEKTVLTILFCMSFAMTVLPCMGDDGESGGSSIGDFVSGIGSGIVSGASTIGSGIVSGASTVGSGVSGVVSGVGDVVSSIGGGIADGAAIIGSGVSGVVGGVGDLVSNVGSGIASGDQISLPDILGANGDLTSNLTDGLSNLLSSATGLSSIPSIGNLGNAADFPLVGPNIGYKRMLWLFSGESQLTSIKALFSGVISGIQDVAGTVREAMKQFNN